MDVIDFDLRLRRGSFALHCAFRSEARVNALVGPSGAGKSTLLDAIAGLLKPLGGWVRVMGQTLYDEKDGIDLPARRRHIGYVFQESRLFPHLDVAANLDFGARYAAPVEQPLTRSEIIALLALESLLTRNAAQLSGGERQRVALGRALLAQPRLLLLDEPMSHIDQSHRQALLPYLLRLRDQLRLPMLYVSHQRDELVTLAQAECILPAAMRKGSR